MDSQYYIDLYNILCEKQHNEDIEWQDVADMRARYGINETRDCARKGAKFFYEFINGGWEIKPKTNAATISTKETVTINADRSETSERTFYIEDESKLRDVDYLCAYIIMIHVSLMFHLLKTANGTVETRHYIQAR